MLTIRFNQVKEVFTAIAPAVGLSVGLAVGQSSIADEISQLIKRPKLEAGICYDPEDFSIELQSSVDILVATPGRLMDHINFTKGFTLQHLRYLVSTRCIGLRLVITFILEKALMGYTVNHVISEKKVDILNMMVPGWT